jgi:hypothetical protein
MMSGLFDDEEVLLKTPSVCFALEPVSIQPLEAAQQISRKAPLTPDEAMRIVEGVRPLFRAYSDQYDTGKYWPHTYATVLEAFRQPRTVSAETLRQAILWKYGHLRKSRIPTAHEALIADLQGRWPALSRVLPKPRQSFRDIYG